MVPTSACFEYEAVVRMSEDGALAGLATSLQLRRGLMPGLLGSTPTLRLQGDRLRIEPDPRQLPPRGILKYLSRLIPGCDLEYRRALVANAEMSVPRLASVIKPGQTLRVEYDPNEHINWTSPGPRLPDVADVSVFEDERLVRKWTDVPIVFENFAR